MTGETVGISLGPPGPIPEGPALGRGDETIGLFVHGWELGGGLPLTITQKDPGSTARCSPCKNSSMVLLMNNSQAQY